jgi:thermostable 8-oxoguanine DNA glycosylase
MTQTASLLTRTGIIQVEMPSPDELLMGSVRWGAFDVFPTPAYWQYQVVARRLAGRPAGYKLGRTLAEEVAACLLGGHGIPATVGLAAYQRLQERGAFDSRPPSEASIEEWLKEPLQMGSRQVHYRFAAQKARFLAAALPQVHAPPSFETGRQLRDWLMKLSGVGPKTASWIARNWKDADDVAILDIHIMRIGQVLGLFPRELTVARHYLELEALFLRFSEALDVRASELDAVIWFEMASSPRAARAVIEQLEAPTTKSVRWPSQATPRQRELSLA